MVFSTERENERLKYYNERSDHLRHSLYLAEQACRDDDTAVSCNDEAQTRNSELAEKNNKHHPNENKPLGILAIHKQVGENGYLRADYHKFICKRVDKLAEIGNEVIFSRYLSVEHIGKCRYDEYNRGNDKSPYLDLAH